MANITETNHDDGPTCDPNGDIDVSSKSPSRSDLAKVADLPVLDAAGKSHTFKSLYANNGRQKTLVIFIRHFFCGNCQEYLKTLSSAITPEALQALSIPTQLVIIGCGESSLIPWYTKETACPFPIYADPTKKLYDLLGMTRTLNLGSKHPEYMKSSVPMNTIKSFWQTLRAGRDMMKGGDFHQVGGEFMFEDERVTWCHRMRNTRDHAEIVEMRKVLGLDGGENAPRRKRWSTGLGRSLSERRQSWSRSRSRQSKGNRPASVFMGKVKEEPGENGMQTNGSVGNEVVSTLDGGASEAANGTMNVTTEGTANGHAVAGGFVSGAKP